VSSPEVAVIGAGVAGLAAAGRIAAAGRRVVVIEARERIGGRVYTRYLTGGYPVELGAEFVEGHAPEVSELVREAKLTLRPLMEQHERMRAGVERPYPDILELVSRLLKTAPSHSGLTVAQLIGRLRGSEFTADELQAISAYLQGFHAADLNRFGVEALTVNQAAEEEDAEDQARLVEGYASLVEALARRLEGTVPIETGVVVRRISWRLGEVQIEADTPQGPSAFSVQQAVLTVPLPCLKGSPGDRGVVQLEPLPPGWGEALNHLHMGAARRITLEFDQPWWIKRGQPPPLFVHGGDEPFPVWWSGISPKAPLLTGWIGGPRAERLRGRSPDELEGLALSSAANVFGQNPAALERQLRASYTHDWCDDPFSRGAYSYGGLGGVQAMETLRQPVSRTLFLGGEAVAGGGHNATVPGALASGYAAAAAVLRRPAKED
jgi:monoamine oxidase